MGEQILGISASLPLMLAFPRKDGRWALRQGTLHAVDGLHHKIEFPGFESRSGEGFGMTATYHISSSTLHETAAGLGVTGDISEVVIQNGAIASVRVVARGVEIVME
jgi:hypothetical protein